MKKLFFLTGLFISGVSYGSNNAGSDLLTGSTKLACEAILCLSTSTRPSECAPSLAAYFGIKDPKSWAKTLSKRRSFLDLCPVTDDGDVDELLSSLKDDINVLKTECTADALNKITDSYATYGGKDRLPEYYYRTTSEVPTYCVDLAKHSYTDIKLPTYICDGKYYKEKYWKMGYIPSSGVIKKDCWID